MSKILNMGPAPHVRTTETVDKVMYDVVIALIPAFIVSIYVFGIRACFLVGISIISCMLTEYLCQKVMKKDIFIFDGSAIITGILFAFIVPVYMSYVYVVVGSIVSILIGKMLFGGLGHNIFNPALVGRAFVQASWPVAITKFYYDGEAGATVLDAVKRGIYSIDGGVNSSVLLADGNQYIQALIGNMGGCLGETSGLAIIIGGLYLIYRNQIDWKVPAIIIAVVWSITFLFGVDPTMQILSGGLLLGAFFMATDMVTSPFTEKGKILYALGIGLLIGIIRMKGGYPEGTAYSILIMNGVVPIIDKYTLPKKFGEVMK